MKDVHHLHFNEHFTGKPGLARFFSFACSRIGPLGISSMGSFYRSNALPVTQPTVPKH